MSDGSISLILPDAQDDELALGLMFRIARLNGASYFGLEASIKRLAKGEGSSTLIAGLAKAYGQSPSAFAQRHTLLPFRHAFSKQELRFDDAYWTSGHMWRRATPIMVGPEIRFCEMCAAADVASSGVSQWRRAHQIPGIALCAVHGIDLSVVATPKARNQLPHELLALAKPASVAKDAAEIVTRYGEIAIRLLRRDRPQRLYAVQTALRTRAKELGLRIDRKGEQRSVSDLVSSTAPLKWLRGFITVRDDRTGKLSTSLDSIFSRAWHSASSEHYVLALAALFPSPDEAFSALEKSSVYDAPPLIRERSKARNWTSQSVISTLIKCNGALETAAGILKVNHISMSVGLKKVGVISLVPLIGTGMDRALLDFFDGSSVEEASAQHGVSPRELQKILRRTSALFASVLRRTLKRRDASTGSKPSGPNGV